MKRHVRAMGLFACITAVSAFGSKLALASTSSAEKDKSVKCGEQQRHGRHKGDFFKKMSKELGLSTQQQTQAKAIYEAGRAQNKPLFESMRSERRQLHSMIMSGSAEESAIRAQSAKVAAIQADLAVKRAQQTKQLLALLTPEQVTKLKALMEKREQRFEKFRGHGGGRHEGGGHEGGGHEEGPMM